MEQLRRDEYFKTKPTVRDLDIDHMAINIPVLVSSEKIVRELGGMQITSTLIEIITPKG